MLLEIKGPHTDDELVIELAVIRATRTMDRVWLQSFEVDVLAQLAAYDPATAGSGCSATTSTRTRSPCAGSSACRPTTRSTPRC